MMLQINHRESHDVDILLPDPQFLPFLDPRLHDFEFEIMPSGYGGDGAGFPKLAFEGIGEVDFIVGRDCWTCHDGHADNETNDRRRICRPGDHC